MATILNRLTRLTWYGPDLTLSAAPFTATINVIRVVNPGGTGFNSFKPGSLSSYTIAKVGDVLEVDAKNIPNGGFTINNGNPPTGSGNGSDVVTLTGPAGEVTTEFAETYTATSNATPAVTFQTGAGTVEAYISNAWGALPVSIPAGTSFNLRVQHPNSATFSATLTLTYA
jgi:hypothetical protein